MTLIQIGLLAAGGLALVGCAAPINPKPPVRPAESVNLKRYMGDWRVIANIPYWAEKNCYNSIERYVLTADGKIDTTFLARKGGFDGKPFEARSVAVVTDPKTNAQWQIRFLGGLFRIPLVILDVNPDYSTAVVCTPDRKLAWIFAREPTVSDAEFERALLVLERNGIDRSQLQRVPQQAL